MQTSAMVRGQKIVCEKQTNKTNDNNSVNNNGRAMVLAHATLSCNSNDSYRALFLKFNMTKLQLEQNFKTKRFLHITLYTLSCCGDHLR